MKITDIKPGDHFQRSMNGRPYNWYILGETEFGFMYCSCIDGQIFHHSKKTMFDVLNDPTQMWKLVKEPKYSVEQIEKIYCNLDEYYILCKDWVYNIAAERWEDTCHIENWHKTNRHAADLIIKLLVANNNIPQA